MRHADATTAELELLVGEAEITVMVTDHGRGFDPDDTARTSGRLGLLSMRERADMMGGVFEIESSPGTGTTVYVEIPYANQHSDR